MGCSWSLVTHPIPWEIQLHTAKREATALALAHLQGNIRNVVRRRCVGAGLVDVRRHLPIPAPAGGAIYTTFLEQATALGGPKVSVGSGWAALEATVCQKEMEQGCMPEVWCVDPAPSAFKPGDVKQSWPEAPFIQPVAGTVPGLAKEHPGAFEYLRNSPNMTLLLVWCEPEQHQNFYDRNAIEELRPKRVVALHEAMGCAGTKMFHEWRRHTKMYSLVHTVQADIPGMPSPFKAVVDTFERTCV